MASTYLTRATSDPQSSNTTATYSVWVKKTKNGADGCIWGGSYYSSDNTFNIKFLSGDNLQIVSVRGASTKADLRTTRLFRDVNAWYHIVVAIDTTQGTASDRIKLYINGVQETSFSTNTQPSQNENLYLDSGAGANYYIGQRGGNTQYFDGCMSHFHYVDGSQLAPTVFGSTDSTTGEWQINTSPSYTVGTKGFFVLKDGNSGTDQSANSNNFTVGGGTLTKTEDCPSNFFCTMNPLNPKGTVTYSNGNNTVVVADNNNSAGTIGVNSGKYYYEVKQVNTLANGWIGENNINSLGTNLNGEGSGWLNFSNLHGTIYYNGSSDTTPSAGSNNDIIGCAVDFDNGKIYWHQNGTYISTTGGQQNPTTEANPITFTTGNDFWFPVVGSYSSNPTAQLNFGNGFFGTTAVSSAGTNASNNGIFEYDVPAGYTALSTKGLNL